MFETDEQIARAEGVLASGVANNHWHATGLALVIERFDRNNALLMELIETLTIEG